MEITNPSTLASLSPILAVIPVAPVVVTVTFLVSFLEFNTPNSTDEEYEEFIKNKKVLMYYDGDIGGLNKGIAIIAKEDIELEDNNWYYKHNDFLSVRVNDSFDLVAVWTHEQVKKDGK